MVKSDWIILLLVAYLATHSYAQLVDARPPAPSMFAIDPPRGGFGGGVQALALPFDAAPILFEGLGAACASNLTCAGFNGYCANGTCICLPNFFENALARICQIAPGYNEICAEGNLCREPFVCNSTKRCDCASGYVEEYFQCVKDCKTGEVAINDTCYAAKELGESCEFNEQCIQAYSDCIRGTCACIDGAPKSQNQCNPVNQCPIGEPSKLTNGQPRRCRHDLNEQCPPDHYCIFAELTDTSGFCCPKLKMKCPIGEPLVGKNCSNCPWETHHCFSYVIGSYTDTMCCPNACPSSQPIQKDGKCYSRTAFGGHCSTDEQCYSVLNAVCRKDAGGQKKCLCAEGPFFNSFGQCLRRSFYNETCTDDRECHGNTRCADTKRCLCPPSWMAAKNDKICIPKPTCPVSVSQTLLEPSDIEYCDPNVDNVCGDNKYCHSWWHNPPGADGITQSYNLCCQKPKSQDFDVLCKPYQLTLMLTSTGEPLRCDVTTFQAQSLLQDGVSVNGTAPESCPLGAACLFDPYLVTKGVCCKPVVLGLVPPAGNIPAKTGQPPSLIKTPERPSEIPVEMEVPVQQETTKAGKPTPQVPGSRRIPVISILSNKKP